jgi:hypothetical protein
LNGGRELKNLSTGGTGEKGQDPTHRTRIQAEEKGLKSVRRSKGAEMDFTAPVLADK